MLTLANIYTRMKEESHVDKNNAIHVDTIETIPEGTRWSQSQRPGVFLQLKLQCTSFPIYYTSQKLCIGDLI